MVSEFLPHPLKPTGRPRFVLTETTSSMRDTRLFSVNLKNKFQKFIFILTKNVDIMLGNRNHLVEIR